jgi:serine O-acetyltransferase
MALAGREHRRERKELLKELYDRQPSFREAVRTDTHAVSFHRGEYFESADASDWYVAWRALRLMWVSDAFFAQVAYRARMRMGARGVPLLPRILQKLGLITAQLSIDEMTLIEPGANIAHGQAVIGGLTEIGRNCTVSPWVSIGLVAGDVQGPKIGDNVFIGTGAKVLGNLTVGDGAVIGSQALVIEDVPAGAIVGGIPAKVIGNNQGFGSFP